MARDWGTMTLDMVTLDILVTISMKLETFEDFIYFSLVCRWWNRVGSSIKNDWRAIPAPWLLLAENNKDNPKCLRKILNLKNNKCYEFTLPETFETRCWGSPYGWFTMIDRCLNVKLFNPISKAHIPFPTLENFPTLDEFAFRLDNTRDKYINWCLTYFVKRIFLLKASQSCRHEFVIVVVCASECVAVARPGDQSWTPVVIDGPSMQDIMVVDDRVFALYRDGRLVYWNAKEFFNLEFVKQFDYSPSQPHILGEHFNYYLNKVYMVQLGSEFIMVIRYKDEVEDETTNDCDYEIVYETYEFEVFKLNPTNKLWEEIEELCGVALLVGCHSSMAVPSGNYLHENSIYFSDDESDHWGTPIEFGGHDMGVFNFKIGEFSRFYEGGDTRSLICAPTLFIPQL